MARCIQRANGDEPTRHVDVDVDVDVERSLQAVPGAAADHLRTVAHEELAEAERAARAYLDDPGSLEPIGPGELKRRLSQGDVVVIDVRPPEEYAAAHITPARSIPLEQLEARLAELPLDAEIVAYCRGNWCVYAPEAARLLQAHGYDARTLSGGWPQWRAARLPIATGGAE